MVSFSEGYANRGQALGTEFVGAITTYGNDPKVIEYALKAVSVERLDDATIIVLMNEDKYAGNTILYYPPVFTHYGRGLSISYLPTYSNTDSFICLVSRSVGGLGFAKLGSEFAVESNGEIPIEVCCCADGFSKVHRFFE